MNEWSLIIFALVSLCLTFGIAFVVSRHVNNYGFVDVVWSYSGVRPLIDDGSGKPESATRGYSFELDGGADGTGRVVAYVLNMTPDWPADFGGQLQFADVHGRAEEVFTPRLNTLSMFAVPSSHLVSAVAPFVPGSRYAITGWFQ